MSHEVSELSRRDVAIAILVKVAKTLNEVIGSVNRALTGDGLHDRQEHLKADPLIWKTNSIKKTFNNLLITLDINILGTC